MEPIPDGSVDETQFSVLLTRAIAARGLSLARVKAHLAALGQPVSIATLSYWCSGRSLPTRARSLDVVHALETVLQVPRNHLTSAIRTHPEQQDLVSRLEQDPLVADLQQRFDLPPLGMWRPELVFHHATVDSTGRQRSITTRIGFRAVVSGAQGWAIAVDRAGEADVEARGDGIAPLRRQIRVSPDLTVLEFGLDQPVKRDTIVMAQHEVNFAADTAPVTSVGYGLSMPAKYFSLTVDFVDKTPRNYFRCHAFQRDGAGHRLDRPVLSGESTLHCALTDAAPGYHSIEWEW